MSYNKNQIPVIIYLLQLFGCINMFTQFALRNYYIRAEMRVLVTGSNRLVGENAKLT
jgi:hypothetical protein